MIAKFAKFALCAVCAITLSACATTTTEYVEKKVPIRCEVKKTQLPAYTDDPLVDIPNILIYTEVLEEDLKFCTSGTTKD